MLVTATGKFCLTFIVSLRYTFPSRLILGSLLFFPVSLIPTKAHYTGRNVWERALLQKACISAMTQRSASQSMTCIQYQCLDSCHSSPSPLFHVPFNVNPISTLVYKLSGAHE